MTIGDSAAAHSAKWREASGTVAAAFMVVLRSIRDMAPRGRGVSTWATRTCQSRIHGTAI